MKISSGVWAIGFMVLISTLVSGCGRSVSSSSSRDIKYGFSNGTEGNQSLIGYGALRRLFQQRGYKTFSATTFSKSMDPVDVIFWTPDTFTPPSVGNRDHIETWLAEKTGRTVIYVGRDFEASTEYWERMVERQPLGSKSSALREQMLVEADSMRRDLSGRHFARWFTIDTTPPKMKVQGLRGPFADGIDASSTRIFTRTEIRPVDVESDFEKDTKDEALFAAAEPLVVNYWDGDKTWAANEMDNILEQEKMAVPNSEVLLSSDDGRPLVFELTSSAWGTSRIIVVANGSFLQNGSLVLPEHRKLAAKLIDRCGDSKRVAFLRSTRRGVPVRTGEESPYSQAGLEMFAVWPLSLVTYHLAILGIMMCFIVMPIFGRPRELVEEQLSDFGQHIEALGGMLARTKNEDFAREKISDYFRLVRKDPKHPWCLPQAKLPLTTTKPVVEESTGDLSASPPVPFQPPMRPESATAVVPAEISASSSSRAQNDDEIIDAELKE